MKTIGKTGFGPRSRLPRYEPKINRRFGVSEEPAKDCNQPLQEVLDAPRRRSAEEAGFLSHIDQANDVDRPSGSMGFAGSDIG